MGKCKDTLMIIADLIFLFWIVVAVYLSVLFRFFFNDYPVSYVGGFGQFAWFYIWIRIRMASEYISQLIMYRINFYGLMYSIMNTIFATIVLLLSYKDKDAMYQKQLYFVLYMACWGLGLTQITIYVLWHQVFTGINYEVFHHRRQLTVNERQMQNDLDEYLMNLSNSSESRGEDSGENKTVNIDDPTQFKVYNYIKNGKTSDEFWSICLDPFEKGQKVVETKWTHVFHKRWIKSYFDTGKEDCPNCRKNVNYTSPKFERQTQDSENQINETIQSDSNE